MFKKLKCIYFASVSQLWPELSTASLSYLCCLFKQYLWGHLLLWSWQKANDKKADKTLMEYHPADSFPTFSPAISSTKYQCLDWLTLEIFFRDMCSRTWVPEDCKLSNHCISVNPTTDISNSWVLYSNRLCFQSFFHHPCGILGQWRNWRLT